MLDNYGKFGLMLAISFVLMYYAIIFLNVVSVEHIYINMTRAYMTLMMIAAIALLMLLMIPMIYPDKKKNTVITVSSFIVLLLAFAGVHIQVGVADIQYMKGMIPHYSIAIMTSQNAHITGSEGS